MKRDVELLDIRTKKKILYELLMKLHKEIKQNTVTAHGYFIFLRFLFIFSLV